MLPTIRRSDGGVFPHDPAVRGYHAVYRMQEVNHCPGCGRSHWIIGRLAAECGFCATALPLEQTGIHGTGLYLQRPRHAGEEARLAA